MIKSRSRGVTEEQASALTLSLRLIDCAVVGVGVWIVHRLYLDEVFLLKYQVLSVIAPLLVAVVFPQFSIYRGWRERSFIEQSRLILSAWCAVLLTLIVLVYLSKLTHPVSRGWFIIWFFSCAFLFGAVRLLVYVVFRHLRHSGLNQRRIVIAGEYEWGNQVIQKLQSMPWFGFTVVALFHDGDSLSRLEAPSQGVPMHGRLENVHQFVEGEGIDEVWLALPLRDEAKISSILHDFRHSTVDIRWLPNIFGLRLINHAITEIAGIPAINLSVTPMQGVNRILKAVEDRVVAALVLCLGAPVFLLIAVAVKLSSSGPILYRQPRIGWNGKTFEMLKFRSMAFDAETLGWGNVDQKPVTKVGAILRKTSLDELPQFLNVLKGEMSVVGPRPERVWCVDELKTLIPNYMKKHLVKAGITGWAQVNGYRGETDLTKRIEHDLYYIEHWSLWLDLTIILRTLLKGFVDTGATSAPSRDTLAKAGSTASSR